MLPAICNLIKAVTCVSGALAHVFVWEQHAWERLPVWVSLQSKPSYTWHPPALAKRQHIFPPVSNSTSAVQLGGCLGFHTFRNRTVPGSPHDLAHCIHLVTLYESYAGLGQMARISGHDRLLKVQSICVNLVCICSIGSQAVAPLGIVLRGSKARPDQVKVALKIWVFRYLTLSKKPKMPQTQMQGKGKIYF